MKNVLYILAVAGMVAFAVYDLPKTMRKVAVADCWKAKEICDKYWDAHGGDCLECKTMNECQQKGLFEE